MVGSVDVVESLEVPEFVQNDVTDSLIALRELQDDDNMVHIKLIDAGALNAWTDAVTTVCTTACAIH